MKRISIAQRIILELKDKLAKEQSSFSAQGGGAVPVSLPGDKGKMDKNAVAKAVREIAVRYGFDIDPNQKIYEMSVSQKQTVEIVKVLYRGADILILDEPIFSDNIIRPRTSLISE